MADSPRPADAPDPEAERLRRLEALLARRGLPMRRLATGRGHVPEALASASRDQRSLVVHAKGFPWPGPNGCAAWVEGVFQWFGLGLERGDARALYERHCTLTDPGDLRVGMIVAVPRCPASPQAARHGHVGIYVGDGMVMDSADHGVRTVPLALWYGAYGAWEQPRWGWMRGVVLA